MDINGKIRYCLTFNCVVFQLKFLGNNSKIYELFSGTHGAFCDHCTDGFVEFDEAEEASWLAFRDRVDAAEDRLAYAEEEIIRTILGK